MTLAGIPDLLKSELDEVAYILSQVPLAADGSNQFIMRSVVRSTFAFVDATISSLKQHALANATKTGLCLSDAERAMLNNATYYLDDKGLASEQPKFIRVDRDFQFAVGMFGRVLGKRVRVRTDTEAWAGFKRAISIRNRITHPKKDGDLQTSLEDLLRAALALMYFLVVIAGLHQLAHERAKASVGDQLRHLEHSLAEMKQILSRVVGTGHDDVAQKLRTAIEQGGPMLDEAKKVRDTSVTDTPEGRKVEGWAWELLKTTFPLFVEVDTPQPAAT